MEENGNLQIFTGTAHPEIAKAIAEFCGVKVAAGKVLQFSDGEKSVQIDVSVRGKDTFVIQPTNAPSAEHLMELLIYIDALKRASAKSITAVIPYFGYARQDRKSKARDPITAKLVANLLTVAGANRILTMDLHARQIQGFFDIPVDNLLANHIIADYFKGIMGAEDVVVVAPDHGGISRARQLAMQLHAPLAIIDKRRPRPNEMEIMNVIGEIENKTAIMVDDIIDTAGTITRGASALMKLGAKKVYACCVHPVLSGPAIERIATSDLTELVVTDTIALSAKAAALDNIKVLSVAGLFGEAIMRVNSCQSVSALFK